MTLQPAQRVESRIEVSQISITDIDQTKINDTAHDVLCAWLNSLLIAWSLRMRKDKMLLPLSLVEINRINDECIANGALVKVTSDNSTGFVRSHEKIAECVGVRNVTKVMQPYDQNRLVSLLQWGSLVEMRCANHSRLATGFYIENGQHFCSVMDSWKKTDEKRFNLKTQMTEKLVDGKWVTSRKIERIGWFRKNGSDWIE